MVRSTRAGSRANAGRRGADALVGTAADNGVPSSNSGDSLPLTLTSGLAHKSFGTTSLSGGNIVIHVDGSGPKDRLGWAW